MEAAHAPRLVREADVGHEEGEVVVVAEAREVEARAEERDRVPRRVAGGEQPCDVGRRSAGGRQLGARLDQLAEAARHGGRRAALGPRA
jgi:hypothetical protein